MDTHNLKIPDTKTISYGANSHKLKRNSFPYAWGENSTYVKYLNVTRCIKVIVHSRHLSKNLDDFEILGYI